MLTTKPHTAGFSLVIIIVIILIIGAIVGAGVLVLNRNSTTNNSSITQTQASQSEKDEHSVNKQSKVEKTKDYISNLYGFSFQYPEDWRVTENLEDIGRGKLEGDIVVTSPSNTKVYFSPNLGGKGGDCIDPTTDTHTARSCFTREILQLETLNDNGTGRPVYFYHVKLTYPTRIEDKITYYIGLESIIGQTLAKESEIGIFGSPKVDLMPNKEAYYLNVRVEGKDDSLSNSPKYFQSAQVKEATPILKSFRLLE